MIDLLAHFIISLLTGFLFWLILVGKNRNTLFLCLFFALLAGFFVDIDHFFDYIMAYGFIWNFQKFIHEDYFNDTGHNFVLLHNFELVFILALIAFFIRKRENRIFFMIMTTSLLLHIVTDIFLADGIFKEYFLIYRILTGFRS
jgi:hypothetical protein